MESLRESLLGEILDQLTSALSKYPLDQLNNPTLCIEAFVKHSDSDNGHTPTISDSSRQLLLSHAVNLSTFTTAQSSSTKPILNQVVVSENAFQKDPGQYVSHAAPRRNHESPPTPTSPLPVTRAQVRKRQGGLRPAQENITIDDDIESCRQIQVKDGSFPKRAKIQPAGVYQAQESSLAKFVVGVWKEIHSSIILEPHPLNEKDQITNSNPITMPLPEAFSPTQDSRPTSAISHQLQAQPDFDLGFFNQGNLLCRRVTQTSRACRSIEVIVQARWVELFDLYIGHLAFINPGLSPTKTRMKALTEACNDFGWTKKEMRNKMAIWRGYKEIKDAGGWVMLVFSGMGLYRLCKYRIGLEKDKTQRLRSLRARMEVAADTLHPSWRQLLAIVGESTRRRFTGHPHDWVVHQDGADPTPLRLTYLKYDPNFSFEHIEDSTIDTAIWGTDDPRWTPPPILVSCAHGTYLCQACGQVQSDDPKINSCICFPHIFAAQKLPCPVQVFRTTDGRNNGLQALVPFERGIAVGEFTGLITKEVEGLDVMDSSVGATRYQIWQGRQGNFTRFINHSCKPNAQFQHFVWLGIQRVLLVSKGIDAGVEITVDYSGSYWRGLDKRCLCSESCCRYNSKA